MASLTIVIPVYNEEVLIKDTLLYLKGNIEQDYRLVLVDDYSSDSTYKIVQESLSDFQNLKLVSNCYKKGFGNALKTGLGVACSEVVIPVMADLCDEIDIIPLMYKKILEGYDIVCASRYLKGGRRQGGSILKAFLSRCAGLLIHKITKIPTTDITNSFKAYRRDILENIPIRSNGFEISMEITLKAYFKGYKITEIFTKWKERTKGRAHFIIFRDGIKFIKWFIFGLCMPLRFRENLIKHLY